MQQKQGSILVIGGTSFLGSAVLLSLALQGYRLISLDTDNITVRIRGIENRGIEFIIGSSSDKPLLEYIFSTYTITTVIDCNRQHCDSTQSCVDPVSYYRSYLSDTLTLISAMRTYSIQNLIVASSVELYGDQALYSGSSLTEESFQKPISPYGRALKVRQVILRDIASSHAAYPFRIVSLQFTQIDGAILEAGIGSLEPYVSRLVRSAEYQDVWNLSRTHHRTADQYPVRDYINIRDAASAVLQALLFLEDSGKKRERFFEPFIIGSGISSSLTDLLTCYKKYISDRPVRIKESPPRTGEISFVSVRNNRARLLLNWQPECSHIREILRSLLLQGEQG